MQKLAMCRVCLGEDMQLHAIVDTHLQEMYESLAMMPLLTSDGRPLLVCYICRARLDNCFELRWSCQRSEKLLTQMLSSNEPEQVELQRIDNKRLTVHNVVQLSIGDVLDMNADNVGVEGLKCEVKHEANDGEDIDEKALEENSGFDNEQSGADSDDDSVITMMEEQIGDRRGDPTLRETTQDDLSNPEDLTFSDLKDHELVQDNLQAVYKFTAADGTAVTSTNEETFTLADDNKEIPTSVPRSERVQYTCDTCQQCYSSKCELERHIRLCSDVWKTDVSRENSTITYTQTAQKPHQCNVCNKSFISRSHLTRHMSTHTGEKPFECTVCKKKYSSEGYLRIHMRQHTGEELYQCNICKQQFSKKGYLRQHMRTHSGEKTFECTVCKKQYSSKQYLTIHMRTHTGEKPYQCDLCEKQFSQKHCMREHCMRTHSGVKPYQCNECKKRFLRKYCLSIHMRTHSGVKPYQCNECKKRFSRKGCLSIHMRIHTGEKPYQCDICKKRFLLKSCMIPHLRTHTGEKSVCVRYQCYVCKKILSRIDHLRQHMQIHTGEKLYECNICQKQLSQKYHLMRHMRTHTGEKPFECTVCKKQFSQKYNLNKHIRSH